MNTGLKMIKKTLSKFTCDHFEDVQTALRKIEDNTKGILIVLHNSVVVGVVTDGDIRRYLLDGPLNYKEKVRNVCNTNFIHALESEPYEKVISLFSKKIKFLPILDANGVLVDIQFADMTNRKSIPEKISSRAPARITFGGGGSDKLDYFSQKRGVCINAAIKKYAFCTLYSSDRIQNVQIVSSDYDASWEFKDINNLMQSEDPRLLIYQKILSFLDFKDPLKIITHCDFPVGSGLGGSSALTVAMLNAFSQLQGISLSRNRLAKDAYKLERIAMDISGGWQDQYAAAVGGINAIYFSHDRHDVHNIKLADSVIHELETSLYLCFSGTLHDSSEIHKSIDLNETERSVRMGETVRLADEMLRSLTDEDLSNFDKNMNENWALKKQYSSKISNAFLDEKISFLMESGAKSAKILGAGGGGYFLVRVPSDDNRTFISRCAKEGIIPERVSFDMEGAKSW